MCKEKILYGLRLVFVLALLSLSMLANIDLGHGQTENPTSELQAHGEVSQNGKFTLASLSDDLVNRLIERIKQLDALKLKSENLERDNERLQLTLGSLVTTLGETLKSRDDFKLKYEESRAEVNNAKATMQAEIDKVRIERDNAVKGMLLTGAIAAPVGGFAVGWAASGDAGKAAIGALVVVLAEAVGYGGFELYKYTQSQNVKK